MRRWQRFIELSIRTLFARTKEKKAYVKRSVGQKYRNVKPKSAPAATPVVPE